jgi:transcriptional regulator with XRE-family HTH domain
MDKAEWQAFGEWVESLRRRSGLRVKDLAEQTGMSVQWLQEIRHGGRAIYGEWRLPNPTHDALARLARALDVPVEEMFARAGRGTTPDAQHTQDQGDTETGSVDYIRKLEERVARTEEALAEIQRLLQERQGRRAKAR